MENRLEALMQDSEKVGEVIVIPRSHIRPFANQPRKYFDQAKLMSLAESIKETGQLVPIFVRELENNNGSAHRYELIDGQRRWHACDIAGVKKMKAIVLSVQDEEEQFTISVISNFGRVDHDAVETALAIKRFRDNNKTVAQIAKTFARSEPWVYQHLKILKLDQEVLNMMSPEIPEEDRLIFSTALLLADLPPDLQKKIAKTVVGNKIKHLQAKNIIRSRAEKLGIKIGDPDRAPNKDYNVLRSFVGKVKRELEVFLSMPQTFFDRMFQSRDGEEHGNVVDKLEHDIEDLKALLEAVKKAKKK